MLDGTLAGVDAHPAASALAHDLAGDALPVTFEVVAIEPVNEGKLVAVASVLVEVAGIEMTVHMAIRRDPGGGSDAVVVEMPTFACRGQRVAALILPEELTAAIGREVWEVYRDIAPKPVVGRRKRVVGRV